MKLEDIDLTDEDVWADHIPHDQFAFLRREAPVFRHPGKTEDERPIPDFWALTRHADVQMVNRDTTVFSSERDGVMISDPDEETRSGFQTMLDTDPPAHTRLRRLVNRGFTPRMVTRFEEHYAQLTARPAGQGRRPGHLRLRDRRRRRAAAHGHRRAARRARRGPPQALRVEQQAGRQLATRSTWAREDGPRRRHRAVRLLQPSGASNAGPSPATTSSPSSSPRWRATPSVPTSSRPSACC